MADLSITLGLKPGQRVCFLGPTAARLRDSLPDGSKPDESLREGPFERIYLWPRSLEGLVELLNRLAWNIAPGGANWLVLPKAAAACRRGLGFTGEDMQALALETDLVDNKVASLTDEEYATRLVIRKERWGKYKRMEPGA